jgi:hypothetical protein
MTFYTTITFNNSLVGDIKNHPKEFADKVIRACSGDFYRRGEDSFGVGIDTHLAKIQKPRNGSQNTVFVFDEGVLYDMDTNSSLIEDFIDADRNEYQRLVNYIADNLSGLQSRLYSDSSIINSGDIKIDNGSLLSSAEFETKFTLENGFGSIPTIEERTAITDEDVAKWLKDNKIPITLAKLKKYKKPTLSF